ncbi:MAG: hypothetical protein AAGH89_02070 [Verrucomicrobiota bacterium]
MSEASPEASNPAPSSERKADLETLVTVATNPFSRWLLKYFWVPILFYVAVSIGFGIVYDAWFSMFQWSFVPAHLLGFGLASYLLRVQTPRLLKRLVENGALALKDAQEVGQKMTRRMNGRGCQIFAIIIGLAFLIFSFPDALLAYLLGLIIWKGCVVGWAIHRMGAKGKVRLRPFHADGCAGLASVGELCFGGSLVTIASGTFLSFWLVYASWIDPTFAEDSLFQATRPYFVAGLFVVAICTIVFFLLPMWSTHRVMRTKAEELELRYDQIANELAEREEQLILEGPEMVPDQFSVECERIRSLRTILERGRKVPRWPIPVQTKFRFAAAQIPMALGLAASVHQLSTFAIQAISE